MRPVALPVVCERVRIQISLELDGELSMLEQRMLDTHLARCAGCQAYAEDVRTFTDELRAVPLEPIGRPVVVRRARRMVFYRAQVGLAAAVVVAFAASILQLGLPRADSTVSPSVEVPTRFPTLDEGRQETLRAALDRQAFERHRGSVGVS
jgi:predicted anti-sigma-YlaC factor YlaD